MFKRAQFEECTTCRKKAGSPILCEWCLHNRKEMSEMNDYAKSLEKKLRIIQILVDPVE